MKIVVIGTGGQVGRELLRALPPLGRIVACDLPDLDLERPGAADDLIRREAPDAIVNAAAYTAVDRAEAEPERALRINATAVAELATAARRLNALLVHYSTDYVFDGGKDGWYTEADSPAPLGVYGRTKLEGERAALDGGGRHYVFRTSWVYAAHGANFVRTILRLARERDALQVVDDQIGAPTGAALLADVTADVIARSRAAATAVAPGLYHLVPRGATSWHGFAKFILEQARSRGLPLRVQPEQVEPIPTSAYPTAARRPANSRLCTAALRAALRSDLPAWQEGVTPVVAALTAELLQAETTDKGAKDRV
ncbi:MAG: dTDP-4-dehydrorhamnose reductase [Planctomycetia bacterium]